MARRKYSNNILAKNGGLHSARQLKSVRQLMTNHGLKDAILYEFILAGKADKADYQATIKKLMQHIRTKCRAEYIGAYEVGNEKGGLHCHVFVIVETLHHFPGNDLLNVSAGHFIARRIALTGMSIKIAPPQNTMHDGAMFARMDTPAKLANCIEWTTYILKLRSKDAVPGREIYFASEFASNTRKREAKRQKYRDALEKSSQPAPQAAQEALDASVATQTVPSSPVDLSTGKGNHTHTEKASHEGITTPQCGTEGQSHTSTTESGHSSSSGPTRVSTGPRPRVPAYSASTGTESQAIRPGQSHGGAGSSRGQTPQPVTPLSRINERKIPVADSDPLPTKGETTMLTTAQKYIASRYEQAVGLRLNLDEVRAYLLAHGIPRTPAQVVHELDEVYAFAGYADSHQPPAHVSTAQLDKIIDRMSDRDVKLLPIPKAGVYNCLTVVRQSYTPGART
jgi:hypothetical protein